MIDYVETKTILAPYRNSEYWFYAKYKMNLYRGCNHACIYCDSRSDVYQIYDFDRVKVKKDALVILEKELASKRKKGIISVGATSDSYNMLEKELLLTNGALKLINRYGFGISLATKSSLVTRDIPIFKEIKKHSPVMIMMTITASDDRMSKLIEVNADVSSKRFEALKKLSDNGIYCGILLMPICPYLTDNKANIDAIIKKAVEAKVKFIYFGTLTQRKGQIEYYLKHLYNINRTLYNKHIKEFKNDYICINGNLKALYLYFKKACKKNGLLYKIADINNDFKKEYQVKQLRLF